MWAAPAVPGKKDSNRIIGWEENISWPKCSKNKKKPHKIHSITEKCKRVAVFKTVGFHNNESKGRFLDEHIIKVGLWDIWYDNPQNGG